MYNDLVMYRNELKNKIIPKYKIIGITAELILSKELFKKNNDLSNFLEDVFSVKYKGYVMKSRTLIMSRTCKWIYKSSDEEFNAIRKRLIKFVSETIQSLKDEEKVPNQKNPFSGWVRH